MSAVTVDHPDDLDRWPRERVGDRRLTPAQRLDPLVFPERLAREVDPLGRRLPTRDVTHRQLTLAAEELR